MKLKNSTGQITTIFDNLPQVPFTSLALKFQGGSHAVLADCIVRHRRTLVGGADAVERHHGPRTV